MDKHRWPKEIATIEFTFDEWGAHGVAVFQKAHELKLYAGATLQMTPEMNQDGTKNYSARFCETLRAEHADAICGNQTIKDIIFKSPNEFGIFLRYGGANTWLSLKDAHGKTLNDYCKY